MTARPRMCVATCTAAPDLDQDGPLLLRKLVEAGMDVTVAAWDDPALQWREFEHVLVRSTWDYPLRRGEFVAWSRRCRRTINPQHVLAWNTDKAYLLDLAASGVATVPTSYLRPGDAIDLSAAGHADFVVKPSVSGSAADTGRFSDRDAHDATTLISTIHAQGRTVMVQPYLAEIERRGETSLVFLGSEYSHAVRREPLLTQRGVRRPVVVEDVLSTVRAVEPTTPQRAVAEAALDAVPGSRRNVAYARVDLLEAEKGPVVLELELTDCFLFLGFAPPDALERFIAQVVGGPRS